MKPTAEQLRRALEIREQIDRLEKELQEILAGISVETGIAEQKKEKPRKKGKRTMTPEARAKIAAAQRARWEQLRAKKAEQQEQTQQPPQQS